MWGVGAEQGGILQTSSGKLELKEPYYRLSQPQPYTMQDQQPPQQATPLFVSSLLIYAVFALENKRVNHKLVVYPLLCETKIKPTRIVVLVKLYCRTHIAAKPLEVALSLTLSSFNPRIIAVIPHRCCDPCNGHTYFSCVNQLYASRPSFFLFFSLSIFHSAIIQGFF